MIKLKEIMDNNKIKVNRYLYHVSNPKYRNKINKYGLKPKIGEQRTGELSDVKAIFATNTDDKKWWFDSTYDDDVWRIDTKKSNNRWYTDKNFDTDVYNPHVVTFTDIPKDAISLIYKGTGSSK
jgi:hypothetical protein